jgi:AcrR family transcriptional regulator
MDKTNQTDGTGNRILTASAELFRRKGYAATGMKAIAQSADAPFGSLYHFFPGGKAALCAAVIDQGALYFCDLIEAQLAGFNDPVEAIHAFFDAAASAVEASNFQDACPLATIAGELADTDEQLRMACADAFNAWSALAARHFIRMGLSVAAAKQSAECALAALEGAFLLARTRRDTTVIRQCGRMVAATMQQLDA